MAADLLIQGLVPIMILGSHVGKVYSFETQEIRIIMRETSLLCRKMSKFLHSFYAK